MNPTTKIKINTIIENVISKFVSDNNEQPNMVSVVSQKELADQICKKICGYIDDFMY